MKIKTVFMNLCILCLFSVFLLPISVYAEQSTTLTVQVPESHTVTLQIDEGGSLEIDETEYTGTQIVKVERLKAQSYKIVPNTGYVVKAVLYNGQDVTKEVKELSFTAPKISNDDCTLSVTFEENSSAVTPTPNQKPSTPTATSSSTSPKTGDSSNIALWLTLLFVSGGVLTALGVYKKSKKTISK